MKLFFIAGYVALDANVDLFVRAQNARDAIAKWHKHFEDWFDEETSDFEVEEVHLTTEDYQVFEETVIARVFDLSAVDFDNLDGVLVWSEIPICALVNYPS